MPNSILENDLKDERKKLDFLYYSFRICDIMP